MSKLKSFIKLLVTVYKLQFMVKHCPDYLEKMPEDEPGP